MKFIAAIASLSLSLPPLISAISVSYDTLYDNAGQSLSTVSCSDGYNGLLARGFTTFGSLPKFPRIGGAEVVEGYDSANCGTCWNITYTSHGVTRRINVLAIDHASPGFNLAMAAMDELTGGHAVHLGRIDANATQVAASVCGL